MAHSRSAANLLATTNSCRALVGEAPLTMGSLALALHQQLAEARWQADCQRQALAALPELEQPQCQVTVDELQGGQRRATVRLAGAEAGFSIEAQSHTWTAEPEDTVQGWQTAATPAWQSLGREELEERLTDLLLEREPEFFAPQRKLGLTHNAVLWLVHAGPRLPRLRLEHSTDDEQLFAPRANPEGLAKFLAALARDDDWRFHARVLAGAAILQAAFDQAVVPLGAWTAGIRQAVAFAARCNFEVVTITLPPLPPEQQARLTAALPPGLRVNWAAPGAFGAHYPDGGAVEAPLLVQLRQLVCEALAV